MTNKEINEQCYIQKNNGERQKKNQCKTSKQRKNYLKSTSKPSYTPYKILDNNLVAILKENFD